MQPYVRFGYGACAIGCFAAFLELTRCAGKFANKSLCNWTNPNTHTALNIIIGESDKFINPRSRELALLAFIPAKSNLISETLNRGQAR